MSTLSVVTKGINTIGTPVPIMPDSYNRSNNGMWMFNQVGGYDFKFTYTNLHSSLTAFRKCPPLYAIISKKAQAFVNGKTWVVKKKGKGKEKESLSPVADKIRALLAKPNPFQSQKEFEAQMYHYCQLYGFSILLPIVPVGFPNYDATKLWNLPLELIDIEETKKNWLQAENNQAVIKSIVIRFGEENAAIPVNSVFIFKDNSPAFDSPIFPISRVCAHEAPINNIIGTYETRGRIIDDRGAQGIISSDSKDAGGYIPIKPDEKEQMQKEFMMGYGLKKNQYQYIITSASVKWTQITQSTKDLMLFEEVEDDIMRLCDGWNYPYPLMSSNRTNSLGGNNIGESKKLLYQDAIIPEAESICEQWNNFFGLGSTDIQLEKDYSHVPALHEDEQKKATARKINNEARMIEFLHNVCTLDNWRVANGDDPLQGEYGGKYYHELVAAGWKFGSIGATAPKQGDNNTNEQQNTGNNQ